MKIHDTALAAGAAYMHTEAGNPVYILGHNELLRFLELGIKHLLNEEPDLSFVEEVVCRDATKRPRSIQIPEAV